LQCKQPLLKIAIQGQPQRPPADTSIGENWIFQSAIHDALSLADVTYLLLLMVAGQPV